VVRDRIVLLSLSKFVTMIPLIPPPVPLPSTKSDLLIFLFSQSL